MTDSPFVCDLNALTATQRENHQHVVQALFSRLQSINELSNGYALQLPADTDTILKAAEFITAERLCCSFINFTLEVGEKQSPLVLKLTGAEGVKTFLMAELGIVQWMEMDTVDIESITQNH